MQGTEVSRDWRESVAGDLAGERQLDHRAETTTPAQLIENRRSVEPHGEHGHPSTTQLGPATRGSIAEFNRGIPTGL